jgi:predicted MFS family arabinose efflux permease
MLGVLRIEQLYLVAIATGALTVLFDTAYHSYVPSVVERERLVEANSKLGMSDSVAEIAGPPLGGVLVQLLSAPFAVLFDALSFVLSALAIGRIRAHEPQPPVEQHSSIRRDIAEGLRSVLGDARLRALLGCSMTRNLGGGFFVALYDLYLVRDLGFSPALVGLTVGVGGIGALAGAFLAEPLVRRWGMGRVLLGAQIISSVVGISVPLAHGPLAITVPVLMASQLSDVAYAVYAINETSMRQSIVPERLLGRVASSFNLLTTAALLLGTLLGGVIGDAWGARTALALAVAIGMGGSLWLLASPFRRGAPTEQLPNAL